LNVGVEFTRPFWNEAKFKFSSTYALTIVDRIRNDLGDGIRYRLFIASAG